MNSILAKSPRFRVLRRSNSSWAGKRFASGVYAKRPSLRRLPPSTNGAPQPSDRELGLGSYR
eukprot:3894726-Lingulodinium_polyedra.AAC.1